MTGIQTCALPIYVRCKRPREIPAALSWTKPGGEKAVPGRAETASVGGTVWADEENEPERPGDAIGHVEQRRQPSPGAVGERERQDARAQQEHAQERQVAQADADETAGFVGVLLGVGHGLSFGLEDSGFACEEIGRAHV